MQIFTLILFKGTLPKFLSNVFTYSQRKQQILFLLQTLYSIVFNTPHPPHRDRPHRACEEDWSSVTTFQRSKQLSCHCCAFPLHLWQYVTEASHFVVGGEEGGVVEGERGRVQIEHVRSGTLLPHFKGLVGTGV